MHEMVTNPSEVNLVGSVCDTHTASHSTIEVRSWLVCLKRNDEPKSLTRKISEQPSNNKTEEGIQKQESERGEHGVKQEHSVRAQQPLAD